MKIKKISILLLASLLLILTGCLKKTTQQTTTQESEKQASEAETFENLETYKNDEFAVEFKYPDNLFIYDCPYILRMSYNQYDSSICKEGPREKTPPLNISISPENSQSKAKESMQSNINWHEKGLNVTSKENIQVGGNPAVRIIGTFIDGGMRPELKDTKYDIIFTSNGLTAYTISLSYVGFSDNEVEKYQAAFDQIVQSLKFIN